MLREEMEMQGSFLFRHRGLFPVPIVVCGVGAFAWTGFNGTFLWFQPGGWGAIGCFAVSVVGLLIRSVVIGYAPPGTSGRNTRTQVAETVNRDGLYSVMRHPLYFGNYLMWLGCVLMTQSLSVVAIVSLVFGLYYERIMFAEEAFVEGKYGEIYSNWARSVPAFFPALSRYQASNLPFNVRKVLRQEVNGLLMLTLVFSVFAVIVESFPTASQDAVLSTLVATLLPLVLIGKVITKKTRLFVVE
jgi:protein-S-isoprenylcysteine O-methyltransferase Ste14